MLGLGLGLNKGGNLLSNLKLLTRNSDWAIWADKATGTSKGTNTPQVNPIVDLVGVVGKNLFDKLMITTDSYINFNTGVLAAGAGNTASGYCKIKPSTQYFLNASGTGGAVIGLAYYDINKNFISGLSQGGGTPPFTTPSNAEYLRFTVKNTTISYEIVQLELGTTATAYEPYGKSNGLLTGFAFTPASGYVDVPIKGVGDEIGYTNLVTNPLLVDSNADGLADGALLAGTSTNRTCSGGVQAFTATTQFASIGLRVNVEVGKRYLIKSKVKAQVVSSATFVVSNPTNNITSASSTKTLNALTGVFEDFSGIYQAIATDFLTMKITEVKTTGFMPIEFTTPQIINLSDNPQVQALESKLGRQLTAAECDYLFDFTATTNTIKAKVVTGIQGDGVNDVIVLPSNAPNPTTGNFAFGLVVKTGANKVKYWLTRNTTNDAATQYAFKMDASGNLFVILEGASIQIGTALSVGFHSIWLERNSGTLKAFIDGVETYTGAHAVTLTSRPNVVMMASTTGAGTYTGFSNDLLLASKYCDSDIAKNRADWFKFDTKVYGL